MKKRLALAACIASLATGNAFADSKLLVSSLLIDSSIAAPVLQYRVEKTNGDGYAIGLSGWTVGGEWRRAWSPSTALLLSADLTPLHAHSSNRIYVDGRREKDLEYDDASYRVKGGVRFVPTAYSTTDLQLVVLKESISGASDPALADFWKRPYAGAEIAHTVSFLSSPHPLVSVPEGIEVTARGEAFSGKRSWSRLSLAERGGKQIGRLHLRQAVMAMSGSRLNTVSRFLVGGSWDTLGPSAFYGSRYAEYRLQHGVTGSVGGDLSLGRNWRAGLRASYLNGDAVRAFGTALNASTTWRTVGLNMGIGRARQEHGRNHTTVYAAIIAPLYQKK